MDHSDRGRCRRSRLLRVPDDLKDGIFEGRRTRIVFRPNPFHLFRRHHRILAFGRTGVRGQINDLTRPSALSGALERITHGGSIPTRRALPLSGARDSRSFCAVDSGPAGRLPTRGAPSSSLEREGPRGSSTGLLPLRGERSLRGSGDLGSHNLGRERAMPNPRPLWGLLVGRDQRPRARAPSLAMKVTRVRRGDFFPSRNETRLAPADFGALNLTRTRRGSFLPSKKETVSLRFASISTPSSTMKAKRPLNPVQAKHYPPPADEHLHGAHH